MACAAVLLITMMARTDVMFADGLRYIDQAQRISRGEVSDGLFRSIDHPGYPLSIAAVHQVLRGEDPHSWQQAAQAASVLAGVLLVIPLYLVAMELFGPRIAWLGCLLFYLSPIPCRVMADTLSESTFLLFWCWGLWTAIRFLREGWLGWLPPMVAFGALAYLTRPEGLLLPAGMVASLLVMPLFPVTRMSWPRWWGAVGFLVLAPILVVGPYVAAKGGLGTKPAMARILGTAPKAPSDSVDRSRPLDPDQTAAETYVLAVEGDGRGHRRAGLDPAPPAPPPGTPRRRGFRGQGTGPAVPELHLHGIGPGPRPTARDLRIRHVPPRDAPGPVLDPRGRRGARLAARKVPRSDQAGRPRKIQIFSKLRIVRRRGGVFLLVGTGPDATHQPRVRGLPACG